jgi:hypothetical protein
MPLACCWYSPSPMFLSLLFFVPRLFVSLVFACVFCSLLVLALRSPHASLVSILWWVVVGAIKDTQVSAC